MQVLNNQPVPDTRLRQRELNVLATTPLLTLGGLLLARLGLQLALYRSGFESLTADEFARTVLAGYWARQPTAAWSGVWLPLHMYLFGAALRLDWELLVVPRLLVGVCGAANILVMYALGRHVFRSRAIGLLAAGLLMVNPAHLWLSSTPLSEIPYTLCVLSAMAAFTVFLEQRQIRWAMLGSLLLALANGFRFEGWMISVVWSLYVMGQVAASLRRRQFRTTAALLGVAALPWIVPVAWIIGNWVQTGDPLFFRHSIQAYKLTWYGDTRNFWAYVDTVMRIDPFVIGLGLVGLSLCLYLRGIRTAVRWFLLITLVPLGLFVYLHGGQLEPPGNYLRYLAPFIFPLYPLVAWLCYSGTQRVRSPRLRVLVTIGVVAVLAGTQLGRVSTYTNDPAAAGLKVGQRIRALRQAEPGLAQRPVLVELSYWQYIAIHVGANDVSNILYDRPVNLEQRQAPSFFASDLAAMRSCLSHHLVSYIVVRSPEVRTVVEQGLGLSLEAEVNGYAFYRVTDKLLAEAEFSSVACPLQFSSIY